MAKMLKINSCADCPHFADKIMNGLSYAFCWKYEKMYEDTDDDIPSWCGLENYKSA